MKEISEAEMVEAIKFAHEAIKVQIDAQERLSSSWFTAYREYEPEKEDESVYAKSKAASFSINIMQLLKKHLQKAKEEKFAVVKEDVKALFTEEEYAENPDLAELVSKYNYKVQKNSSS